MHDGRLEGGERAAGFRALAGQQVAVVPQLLLQYRLLVGVARVGPAGRTPGVKQSLLYQLVAVAVAVHLGPVVVRGAGQVVHGRGGVGSALGHDGRPLVRPVRVLLHVLGKVGLLFVALATVVTDMRIQVL